MSDGFPDGLGRLRALAVGGLASAGGRDLSGERCELCAAPVPPEHRHMVDLHDRRLLCSCRACSILFAGDAAGGGHYRLVPEQARRITGLRVAEGLWESLGIPVGLVFFLARDGVVTAFYPGPAGAIESPVDPESWRPLEEDNPVISDITPDVEALLVDHRPGRREQFVVPVDECYRLVGLFRTTWQGMSGGDEVWKAVDEFFAALEGTARPTAAAATR